MANRRISPAAFERRFAKALDSEVVESGKREYKTVVLRLERLEQSYLSMLPTRSPAALEIKRRIAEQIFEQALLHNCLEAICQRKVAKLEKLGFSNLERKAHFYLLRARTLLSRGNVQLARSTATAILRELERAPRRSRNPLREELLYLTKALVREAEET